jgi:hypothetical protein
MPLGPRQQEVIAALKDGPCTIEALMLRLGGDRVLIHQCAKRLESAGLIRMTGRRGKELIGVWVELLREDRPVGRTALRKQVKSAPYSGGDSGS